MRTTTRLLFAAVAAVAALLPAAEAPAAYPDKPITVIVPFPAGGRTDLVGRIVAKGLENQLGVPVTVVNKPGAGGVLGAKEVARARPDGYTIGVFSSAVVSAQYTAETPTDLEDYQLVGLVETSPAAIAVKADAPWKDLREFVAHARDNPGTLRMGMIPGASAQVFAGGFADAAKVDLVMVPFQGDAPGAVALAGGHIESHVAVPVSYQSLLAADQIRLLGVASEERFDLMPNVPTFREQGVDLVIGSFHGVFVPKGAPPEVVERLDAALTKALAAEDTREQMQRAGLAVARQDRQQALAYLDGQDQRYRQLTEQLGMLRETK